MNTPEFKQHLEKIKLAKAKSIAVMEITNPGHHVAETNLALAWEAIFDHFINSEETLSNLSALNTLSGVIQKLTASYNQLKSLEIKTRELELKEEDHSAKADALKASIDGAKKAAQGLTTETLEQIEQQLKLL